MGYDESNIGGSLPAHPPSIEAEATPAVTGRLIELIEGLRPATSRLGEDFTKLIRHDGKDVVLQYNPHGEPYPNLRERPLGIAAVHDVSRKRKLLWSRHLAPGLYTVRKTVFVERVEDNYFQQRRANVETRVQTLFTLGRKVNSAEVRPATKAEVVEVIDNLFMASAGVTMAYTADNSPDDPEYPYYPPV
jgi:hypothetical protein